MSWLQQCALVFTARRAHQHSRSVLVGQNIHIPICTREKKNDAEDLGADPISRPIEILWLHASHARTQVHISNANILTKALLVPHSSEPFWHYCVPDLSPIRYVQRYVTRYYTVRKYWIELHPDRTKDTILFIPYLEHESVEDTV